MPEWLLLTLVATWCFAVAVLGGLLGLVLGNIRLPVVLAVASSPAAGVGANIAISGVTAGVATLVHRSSGRVDQRMFWVMVPPSIIGVLAGGAAADRLPSDALLVIIGATLIWFGVRMLVHHPDPAAGSPTHVWIRLGIAGAAIGFIGGVVGLILGALRMPALMRLFPGEIHRLVGTNLAVGCVVGVVGGFAHLVSDTIDLRIMLIGSIASIPGAIVGARLTGRLDTAQLVRGIGIMLVVAGLATAARAAL